MHEYRNINCFVLVASKKQLATTENSLLLEGGPAAITSMNDGELYIVSLFCICKSSYEEAISIDRGASMEKSSSGRRRTFPHTDRQPVMHHLKVRVHECRQLREWLWLGVALL